METMRRKRINKAGKGRIILLACLFLLLAAAAGAARAERAGGVGHLRVDVIGDEYKLRPVAPPGQDGHQRQHRGIGKDKDG